MIFLDIFCPACTPYLLLMLLGAWILGWLFWKMFKESGYKNSIKKLDEEVERVNKDNVNLKADVAQAKYEVEKSETEIAKLRSKIGDLDLQAKVKQEEFNAFNETYEKLKAAYDALKS